MKYVAGDLCDERYRNLSARERVEAIYAAKPLAAGFPSWDTMLTRLGLSDDLDRPDSALAQYLEEHLLFYASLREDLPLRQFAFRREEEASHLLVDHLRKVGWGALFAPILPLEGSDAIHLFMASAEALLRFLPPLALEEELIARASDPAWSRMGRLINFMHNPYMSDIVEDGPIISRCRMPLLALSFRALALAYLQFRYRKVRCAKHNSPDFQACADGDTWGVMERFEQKRYPVWRAQQRYRRRAKDPIGPQALSRSFPGAPRDLAVLTRSFPGILNDLWHIQEPKGSFPRNRSDEPLLDKGV